MTCNLGAIANSGSATVSIAVTAAERGHDHEHRNGCEEADRSGRAQQRGERADDRQPGCRPVADEDRLARPGAGWRP